MDWKRLRKVMNRTEKKTEASIDGALHKIVLSMFLGRGENSKLFDAGGKIP